MNIYIKFTVKQIPYCQHFFSEMAKNFFHIRNPIKVWAKCIEKKILKIYKLKKKNIKHAEQL